MPGGRPSKLTPETEAKFLEAIGAGAFPEIAATYAGIDRSTFERWMRLGLEEGRGEYSLFREKVLRAEAEVELLAGSTIKTAALSDPRASVTFLKMRFGKRWREQTVTEMVGADGGPIAHEIAGTLAGLTDDDLDKLVRRLRSATGDRRGGAASPEDGSPV